MIRWAGILILFLCVATVLAVVAVFFLWIVVTMLLSIFGMF